MIERYTRPAMGRIWSDEHRYETWLQVELLACEAQRDLGRIPAEAVEVIKAKAGFDIKRIEEIEAEVRHDVIAFLTSVAEHVGPESRYIHLGMTSYDMSDTALGLRLKEAGELLLEGLDSLREAVGKRAVEHKDTICVGRTHGVHAEPTTFGLKLSVYYDELRRHRQRLTDAIGDVAAGKISGAVGTFAHLEPEVEAYVCKNLGLDPAPASTQILQRDRHAYFLSVLAGIGTTVGKLATEIRNLQRTEILEVEEGFKKGQKGSSAMPHKRNPIVCERVTGMARLLLGWALVGFENVALWHERDLTNSAPERVILPDSCIALDYMLAKMTDVVDGMVVYPEQMRTNLEATGGLIFSQEVLLALVNKGMTREEAYDVVQENAMEARDKKEKTFRELIDMDSRVTERLSADEIEACFEARRHLSHVDTILGRVGLH
ncbi:MAG: adenylosuccinate lyase [Candidatus Latescibacteria bacterium]|nr:adenylosuccinate lyase [Candidatus Latescibacterota bacterium]